MGDDVYLSGDNAAQEWNFSTGRTQAMPKGLVGFSPSQDRAAIVYEDVPDRQLQQCTIGDGCTDVQPSLKTPGGQSRYVVESPSSD